MTPLQEELVTAASLIAPDDVNGAPLRALFEVLTKAVSPETATQIPASLLRDVEDTARGVLDTFYDLIVMPGAVRPIRYDLVADAVVGPDDEEPS